MKKSALMMGMFVLIFSTSVLAWDNKITHPLLTQQGAEASKLKTYLVKTLKLSDNEKSVLKTELKVGGAKPQTILEWLQYGSDQEDDPLCRAANHFHNPLKDWYESGLTDLSLIIQKGWCPLTSPYSSDNIKSAISWAKGFKSPEKETI